MLCTQVRAHSVIIATGAIAKRLGLPHEEEFWSNGISACAVCDGASASFRKQELAVVGGGDTAAEEALYLTKYGTKVALTLAMFLYAEWSAISTCRIEHWPDTLEMENRERKILHSSC